MFSILLRDTVVEHLVGSVSVDYDQHYNSAVLDSSVPNTRQGVFPRIRSSQEPVILKPKEPILSKEETIRRKKRLTDT